ncbi:uncharacterized protein LOC129872553 [Solanum dulcamara]|uniref:uncharacterized protein LOC129872553 n=1 Tax=Solanum dulcamara TaxID=45834 RepID=UPI0024864F19|nr:uncharacterized protein LOC129872553 [Solanum dulcamara]
MPENLPLEVEQFESQEKPNMDEIEVVNLGDEETMKEIRISIHLEAERKKELIEFLRQHVNIFAWSYDDMPGLCTDIVSHRLPIDPTCLLVKQKTRKFKPNLSLRIKEEILMNEDDAEKTAFITSWGVYCYRLMPFGLKNAGATYMRAMTDFFHDMIHKKIEVYVEDIIIKSKRSSDHLYKDAATKWTEECQRAFDKIKEYLSNPPVLVPPEPGRPLLLYLSVMDNAFGCVLGQHDQTGRREQAIYYLSKKFTPYEARYTLLERTCCALTWIAQKFRHYLSAYTTYLISRLDPLKYIFQKPMPKGKLAKWQILLSEFDIVYVKQKAIKVQALADHLAENPVDQDYEPLKTYFPDEEVFFVGEDISEPCDGLRMFFDRASNSKGVGIGAVLISETGQYYPISAKIRFDCTNNMAEYEACILGLRMAIDMNVKELLVIGDSDLLVHQVQGEWAAKNVKILPYLHCIKELSRRFRKIEFKHVPRAQNEFADALATISSMIQHPDKNYIDPIKVKLYDRHAYCFYVDEELDGRPWYYDIKRLIEEIHAGTCGPHMNGFTLAKKILRAGYFWMTMERDSI